MGFWRRLSVIVRGRAEQALGRLEDPERALHHWIVELEERLELSKRAVAGALGHEEELRGEAELHERAAEQWRQRATESLASGREDEARRALRRSRQDARQAEALRVRIAGQERDIAEARAAVERHHETLRQARERQRLLHARMRQASARRASARAVQAIEGDGLLRELARLGEEVDRQASEERLYQDLDDQLSGRDLEKSWEEREVEQDLERLRGDAEGAKPPAEARR